jgi:hypothetical protein
MTHSSVHKLAAGAGLAAAVALAGCGSASHQQTSTAKSALEASAPAQAATTTSSQAATTTSSQASGTTSDASSAAPRRSSGVATPGATFKFGQTATVAYQSDAGGNTPTYKVAVTVASPQRGTLADFNGIQLDASEKAGTPDYVHVKLTNLGPGSINTSNDDPSIELEGVDNTGNLQDNVTFFGTFPRCNQNSAPGQWAAGQSFSTCLTFLVPGGINKVGYVGTNGYLSSPVIWAS